MILEKVVSGPLSTNGYLLGCSKTKKAVVVDVPLHSTLQFLEIAQAHQLHIISILLTHSHWDHIADVAPLAQQTDAQVYVHKEDAPNLKDPGSDGLPLYFPITPVPTHFYLEEGIPIQVGELHIKVLHTPGHSPGSVCFYIDTVLFSGDTLFQGGIGNLSLPTARPHLMSLSLKKLGALPGDTCVYPGHGDSTTIQKERGVIACHQF